VAGPGRSSAVRTYLGPEFKAKAAYAGVAAIGRTAIPRLFQLRPEDRCRRAARQVVAPRRPHVPVSAAPLAVFRCSSTKFTASDAAFAAETLGCQRSGGRNNSEQARCSSLFLAVFVPNTNTATTLIPLAPGGRNQTDDSFIERPRRNCFVAPSRKGGYFCVVASEAKQFRLCEPGPMSGSNHYHRNPRHP
jgi:hypothetical protein